jgi:hypothetical protein
LKPESQKITTLNPHTHTQKVLDERMHHASRMEQSATVAQNQKQKEKLHILTSVYAVLGIFWHCFRATLSNYATMGRPGTSSISISSSAPLGTAAEQPAKAGSALHKAREMAE